MNRLRNLESILPNFFSSQMQNFSVFAIKLGHFIVNTFFHMLQTLKLNSKNKKNKEKQSFVESTLEPVPASVAACCQSLFLRLSSLKQIWDKMFTNQFLAKFYQKFCPFYFYWQLRCLAQINLSPGTINVRYSSTRNCN